MIRFEFSFVVCSSLVMMVFCSRYCCLLVLMMLVNLKLCFRLNFGIIFLMKWCV